MKSRKDATKFTIEEAISMVRCSAECSSCDLCWKNTKHGGDCDVEGEKFYNALDMLIEAAQKQIPEKPTNILYDNGYLEYFNCPVCGMQFNGEDIYNKEYKPAYCDCCGQKLNWDIEENK